MWVIQLALDADSNNTGTITATWTEKTGMPPATFTYSSRATKDTGGASAFISAAIAARNRWQTKAITNTTGAAALLTKMNATDPQAV